MTDANKRPYCLYRPRGQDLRGESEEVPRLGEFFWVGTCSVAAGSAIRSVTSQNGPRDCQP